MLRSMHIPNTLLLNKSLIIIVFVVKFAILSLNYNSGLILMSLIYFFLSVFSK